MDPVLIGLIGLVVLLVLIGLGVYISIAMAVVGLVGAMLITGTRAFSGLYLIPWSIINDFNFAVIPLFVLMSEFVSSGGIAREAYVAARAWIGQIRGGLAIASVGACALFAATSGSSLATALVMGKIAIPEMQQSKYATTLAAGCIAAGGSLGVMIPPSMSFIMIGILTQTSIGKLFMAGILPGVSQAIFYMITIFIMCRINPSLGPRSKNLPLKEKLTSLPLLWPIIVLFVIVMGGLYMGIFTPSESAAVGAFGALTIGLVRRELPPSGIWSSINSTLKIVGMMLLLVATAFLLNRFVAVSRLPFVISDFINGMGIDRYLILALVLFIYVVLGMFFDIMAIIVLTIPIFFPTMMTLGFDPVWYGVLMCRVSEMGFISPPFGINLFGLSGSVNIPLGTLFRGVIPFCIADYVHLIVLVLFPIISLYIPNIMM